MLATQLTTLDRVKNRIFGDQKARGDIGQEYDELLQQLINSVSDEAERVCGRVFRAQTYTRYLDGNGRAVMILPEGPLVSVTSIEYISYGSNAGARTETAEAVNEAAYLLEGLRSEGHLGAGRIYKISGYWTPGKRNLKVVFNAGFEDDTDEGADNLPQDLVEKVTAHCAALYNKRGLEGLITRDVGESSRTTIADDVLADAFDRALTPYKIGSVL